MALARSIKLAGMEDLWGAAPGRKNARPVVIAEPWSSLGEARPPLGMGRSSFGDVPYTERSSADALGPLAKFRDLDDSAGRSDDGAAMGADACLSGTIGWTCWMGGCEKRGSAPV